MDIVIDIQGFRDVNDKFIPKEVAIVSIDVPIVGHWIMMPPHPFGELSAKARRENNWLSQNYHGIEWFDGETNLKYFISHLREITRRVRYIYVRGNEKASYLRNILSRDINNLEDISPPFKNLSSKEEDGRYCSHHGFWNFGIFRCALHNAYKLKYWLVTQNNRDIDVTFSTQVSCSTEKDCEIYSENTDDEIAEEIENKDYVFCDMNENIKSSNEIEKQNLQKIEHLIEKEEEEGFVKLTKSKTLLDENKFKITNITTQTDIENLKADIDKIALSKEVKTDVIQIIPHVRSPLLEKNELSRNFASTPSSRCQTCGSVFCRQSSEGVDEVDDHRC
ncbi:uncharacterized protein [Anoplolepis gracilipes]|uniref:uncharacterized protein n=1 Tax=Anoplolepis gracilipes TaxID=354296 RepID=UPI003BA166E2